MKKYGLALLIVGIILVLVPILFPNLLKGDNSGKSNENNNPINNDKEVTWKVLYGSEFEGEYDLYNREEFIEEYFYSTGEKDYTFIFALPKDESLVRLAYFSNYFTGEMIVEYDDVNITDTNQFANQYIEKYQSNYDKIYIRKMEVNNDKIAFSLKAKNSTNDNYLEELIILYKSSGDNYSCVTYQIQGSAFSPEIVNKFINDFQRKDGKLNSNICDKKTNLYECNMTINSVSKTISFNVLGDKYSIKEVKAFNNYQVNFENIVPGGVDELNLVDEQIYISIALSKDLTLALNNNERLKLSNAKDITINGKTIKKYDLSANDSYHANYLINLDSDLSMFVEIESTKNDLDEVVKDFIDFKLTNN